MTTIEIRTCQGHAPAELRRELAKLPGLTAAQAERMARAVDAEMKKAARKVEHAVELMAEPRADVERLNRAARRRLLRQRRNLSTSTNTPRSL